MSVSLWSMPYSASMPSQVPCQLAQEPGIPTDSSLPSATGQGNVLATAYAFGGGIDNIQPGIDFWKEMATAGRIDQGDILLQRIQAARLVCPLSLKMYSRARAAAWGWGEYLLMMEA